jgi:hypothetical protein
MKKIILRVILVCITLVGIGMVVMFLSLDSIVKKGVETVGPKVTKVDVKLDSAKLSPFSGAGILSKFSLGNPEGFKSPTSFAVGEVRLGVQPGSVMSGTVVINEISIVDPEITLEGSLTANNLSKILDGMKGGGGDKTAQQPEAKSAGEKSQKKFIIKDFLLKGAKVNIDLSVPILGNVTKTLTLGDIHMTDIGAKENGITADQLATVIFQEVESRVVSAATDSLKSLGNGVSGLKVPDNVEKGAKSLMDVFKKP